MGNLFSPGHLLLVVILALLLFGPNKLPELGRAFGRTLKEFKEGVREALPGSPEAEGVEESAKEPAAELQHK